MKAVVKARYICKDNSDLEGTFNVWIGELFSHPHVGDTLEVGDYILTVNRVCHRLGNNTLDVEIAVSEVFKYEDAEELFKNKL